MSKVGKKPIELPQGVEVELSRHKITVKGSKGQLSFLLPEGITVVKNNGNLVVSRVSSDKQAASLHGTVRSIIYNMVKGVVEGWKKELEIVGTGYRAEVLPDGKLVLNVGFSHPVEVKPPSNIKFMVEKSKIIVEGVDKQVVGQIAAKIRAIRLPEPYKGKGIRYADEVIRRKAGKSASSQGS